ncbi:MAG TPA: hypothetical protein VG028_19800 [Terriglobia bacterium]|nr:hypothetical protein [Terriglobia bacterium]
MRKLWAERILVVVSGLAYAGLLTELLLAGRTDASFTSLILGPTETIAVPCSLILLLLRKNPPSQLGHSAVLFFSGFCMVALVLAFPFVAMEVYVIPHWAGGGVRNWGITVNPFIVLAVLAGVAQPSLLMSAGRLSISQKQSRNDVRITVLLGVILGLVIFVPLFALMALAGM